MANAVVLLSGGQDSTTCLFWAMMMFDRVFALGVDYGQRHRAELEAAERITKAVGVPFQRAAVPILGASESALVDASRPLLASGGLVDREMPQGLPTSFVPGRNGVFLQLAATFAVRHGIKDLVTGTCQTDYSGYPDCRREYIDAKERELTLGMPSSCGPIRIHTPLMFLTKAETVDLAKRLPGCWGALAQTVTCYEGQRPGCGVCPACVLRAKGFAEAGQEDPAQAA